LVLLGDERGLMNNNEPQKLGQQVGTMHIDRRAGQILVAMEDLPADTLLTPANLSELWGVSEAWLDQRRHRGDGPAYVSMAPRSVRYRVGAARDWLRLREVVHGATKLRSASPEAWATRIRDFLKIVPPELRKQAVALAKRERA
jgi:hypothetical protein